MTHAIRAQALLLLFLVSCATVAADQSARFWTAQRSFVDVHETWNDLLRMDNAQVLAGREPMFSQRDRDVARLIIRLAYETFDEIEPMLGDASKSSEVTLGIAKVNTLAFQLALLYASSPGGP